MKCVVYTHICALYSTIHKSIKYAQLLTYALEEALHGGAVVPVAEEGLLRCLPDPLVHHAEFEVVHQHVSEESGHHVGKIMSCKGFVWINKFLDIIIKEAAHKLLLLYGLNVTKMKGQKEEGGTLRMLIEIFHYFHIQNK